VVVHDVGVRYVNIADEQSVLGWKSEVRVDRTLDVTISQDA
jgi:hypothetical protein